MVAAGEVLEVVVQQAEGFNAFGELADLLEDFLSLLVELA